MKKISTNTGIHTGKLPGHGYIKNLEPTTSQPCSKVLLSRILQIQSLSPTPLSLISWLGQ